MGRKIFASIVAIAFALIVYPLVFPVAMGGVLAVLFEPCLVFLERRRISTNFASGLLTLAITVVLIMPASVLSFTVAKLGFYQLEVWRASSAFGDGILHKI